MTLRRGFISDRAWNTCAVLGLIVSIGLVGYAILASMQAARAFGPSAVAVGTNSDVFIGVDDQIWRTSDQGRLLQTWAVRELGLPGPPSNLIRHPDGRLAATVRGDPRIYFLDSSSMNKVGSVMPEWPSDLMQHGGRAINLAFHPDGRIAIATGGGHVVALFDFKGKFLARTGEGTYKFTNGLWWVGNELWTTDTNRFMLKVLNGDSLSMKQALSLPVADESPFLGPARVHPNPGSATNPMAALIRFRNGMKVGRVVILSAQGVESPSPTLPGLEPMDVDWLGDSLILTDASSFSILKWKSGSSNWETFGDANLKEKLKQTQFQRQTLRDIHHKGLVAGSVVFVLAFFAAVMAQRQQDQRRSTESPLDLSGLGTPQISEFEYVKRSTWIFWPLLALAPLFVFFNHFLELVKKVSSGVGPGAAILLVVVVALAGQLLFWIGTRRFERISGQPEAEAVLNRTAVNLLRRSKAVHQSLMPSEKILEASLLMPGTRRLLVLTEDRLLVFHRNLSGGLRLQTAIKLYPDVLAVSTKGFKPAGWWRRLSVWGSNTDSWLSFQLRDGSAIFGRVSTSRLAERFESYCNLRIASAKVGSNSDVAKVNTLTPATDPRRVWTTLAAAVFPGLGQWIQRRQSAALKYFLPWLCLLFFAVGPTLWTLVGPKAEVPVMLLWGIAVCYVTVSLFSAMDAWQNAGETPR
jgi:hypothetical protein